MKHLKQQDILVLSIVLLRVKLVVWNKTRVTGWASQTKIALIWSVTLCQTDFAFFVTQIRVLQDSNSMEE